MTDSEKLQPLKSQIRDLEQKKTTLSDSTEIIAINKKINALKKKYGRLRNEVKSKRTFQKSVEREYQSLIQRDND